MARFSYTTDDPQGKPVSGEIEAASESEAREKLLGQGLQGNAASLLELIGELPSGRLSAGEATELASQVAALAKAGLPLGPGLRALAEELPGRRLRRALGAIANRLDRGATLEEAVGAEEDCFPVHLRGLMVAGARSGRLADVLQEALAMERSRGQIRRSVWLSLAYPTLLFAMIVFVFALFSLRIVPPFVAIFRDFGMQLPAITQALLWVCNPTAGMGAILLLMLMVGVALFLSVSRPNTTWAQEALYAVPIVGAMWKRYGLAEFARLMALSLDMEMPLPAALRLTADAVREADLKRACRRAAERIENGTSLTEAMAASGTFPRRLQPLVEWGQRTPALADSFRAAAEMFEGEVGVQRTLLDVVILPIMLVVVVGYVGFFILALMLPLVTLISKLA